MPWVRHPDAGGVKVPEAVKRRTKERILHYAEKYANNFLYKGDRHRIVTPFSSRRRRIVGSWVSPSLAESSAHVGAESMIWQSCAAIH